MMLLPILFLTIFSLNCFKSKSKKSCDCYDILFKEIDKMKKFAKKDSKLVEKLSNFKYEMTLLRVNDDRKDKDVIKKLKKEILNDFTLNYCNFLKGIYDTKNFDQFSALILSFLN